MLASQDVGKVKENKLIKGNKIKEEPNETWHPEGEIRQVRDTKPDDSSRLQHVKHEEQEEKGGSMRGNEMTAAPAALKVEPTSDQIQLKPVKPKRVRKKRQRGVPRAGPGSCPVCEDLQFDSYPVSISGDGRLMANADYLRLMGFLIDLFVH